VSCPEFLKEGSALEDFLKPDRVVVGDERNWAGDAVAELYAPLGAPLVRTDMSSAAMIKPRRTHSWRGRIGTEAACG
jgi:UDPglucose 6-dehydrogenase